MRQGLVAIKWVGAMPFPFPKPHLHSFYPTLMPFNKPSHSLPRVSTRAAHLSLRTQKRSRSSRFSPYPRRRYSVHQLRITYVVSFPSPLCALELRRVEGSYLCSEAGRDSYARRELMPLDVSVHSHVSFLASCRGSRCSLDTSSAWPRPVPRRMC